MVIASLTIKAQKALLVQGLPGVAIAASPGKKGELFTDMHAYSSGQKEPIKKSWHFQVTNEITAITDPNIEVPLNKDLIDYDGAVTLQVVKEYQR